ncbi:Surfeit locus protein 4 [Wickerhamomyces ciferrii]|uniref:Surfeit locus protein 4 n=1 Tax=Wickerhamomyces ciferrii (strain ATCC 14091 / BCRC 22168 / CBS 111 / JCM 3599 / NBRC 0793 / NRRL Y-1031 F-60-10) TaxID=1206466 RepID=K0KM90_WICCF|nr:Surfeit locus protein 4 [Wickerhamomyces ciferrii]CCH46370.1 Surfeit locus protein 4 [Wickerhamomyces ciferrii]
MSFRSTKFNQIPTSNGFNQPQFQQQQQSSESPLQKFEKFSSQIEDLLDHPLISKLKPYVPQIGRFLIVATFYEDSLRILSQWSDQIYYLWNYRHIPYFLVLILLTLVVVVMLGASTLIVLRKHSLYASGALIFVILLQGFMYGLFSGSTFILRNFSLIGGLLIAFSDTLVQQKTRFAGLPEISSNNEFKSYILLAGRILLVLLFFTFILTKSWFTTFFILIGIGSIGAGYKTKFASIILITILTFYNFTSNSYWSSSSEAQRDYLKYEFFQTLSIIGGLLLVVNTGAGEYSIDEKKKIY